MSCKAGSANCGLYENLAIPERLAGTPGKCSTAGCECLKQIFRGKCFALDLIPPRQLTGPRVLRLRAVPVCQRQATSTHVVASTTVNRKCQLHLPRLLRVDLKGPRSLRKEAEDPEANTNRQGSKEREPPRRRSWFECNDGPLEAATA